MPFGEVQLIPGINTERTPTLLQAGYSSSSLIRFKDKLAQKIGGWIKYYNFAINGVPRDLHAWQDLNSIDRLLVGTTQRLVVIDTSMNYTDITPQQLTTNPAPDFSVTASDSLVTIVDPGIANVTVHDTIMLNTPVSIDNQILSGPYQIVSIVGADTYKIDTGEDFANTVNNGGTVPAFTTSSGSATVSTLLAKHGLAVGNVIVFQLATTANGVTISGHYTVSVVTDVNNFLFNVNTQATGSGTFSMNGGNAQIVYNIALGPPPLGAGYGTGGYGTGGYGLGTVGDSQVGDPITATDWTSDNWGQIALACPSGGGVYQWDPTGGFSNASIVVTAPPFNGGIFVSTSLQILFCWGSTEFQDVGAELDPMLVSWSDQGDYTNFTPTTTNQAGSFRIPIGSVIRGGMAVSNQNLFWTDLDAWVANYAGFPLVFGFNKIGSGAGAISSHAMQQMRGGVFWMGTNNFYSYSGSGVQIIPCTVWDAVFQNLNRAFSANVRAMPNTGFNEVGWFYPSSDSENGENDSYVKYNIVDSAWDLGLNGVLPRSAWIDQTVIPNPIGAHPSGVIYSQETTQDADGTPIMASFTTGYFYIAEGEDFAFVDQIIPDMKWDLFASPGSAQISISFNVIDWPGDTPTVYGPYTMNSTTQYISVRFRGRQVSVTVSSSDIGSFWRLGKIRYRYAPAGRR